jgi:hypothetical protein
MKEHAGELGAIALQWLEVMRKCGDEVRPAVPIGLRAKGESATGRVGVHDSPSGRRVGQSLRFPDPVSGQSPHRREAIWCKCDELTSESRVSWKECMDLRDWTARCKTTQNLPLRNSNAAKNGAVDRHEKSRRSKAPVGVDISNRVFHWLGRIVISKSATGSSESCINDRNGRMARLRKPPSLRLVPLAVPGPVSVAARVWRGKATVFSNRRKADNRGYGKLGEPSN